MFAKKILIIPLVAIVLLTACTPQVTSAPVATLAQSEPITLRLAVADGEGYPSEPYVLEFVEQVKILSNGNITIEPVWGAGNETSAGFETGVIQLVRKGELELGLAGSRAWDTDGVTSFQALQAPFLIDNDALAIAVATSDIATQMLDDLSSGGIVGLILWPEDLRHPFSLIPEKPMLSPDDLIGLNFRVSPSKASNILFDSLGSTPIYADSGYEAGESGLRQGASLSGAPTFTGNITFYAKYQVLFANGAAFERLSAEQRAVLREAAAATQRKVIAEHQSDVDAGIAWCADGGTIVLTSDEQVTSFEKAAQPVFDQMEQNPLNAKIISAIRELKANTEPSSGAAACSPAVAQPTPETNVETEVWSEGLPPNGVWQAELSASDILAVGGVKQSAASDSAGIHTFMFQDGKFTWSLEGENTAYCEGTYALVGDVVRLTFTGDCAPEIDDLQWRLNEDGLHLHVVAIKNAPFAEIKANLEAKPYQKIEIWSEGLPPNGVWQSELTIEDLVQMGLRRSVAEEWAGVYTWTFRDGKGQFDFSSTTESYVYSCLVDITVVEDFVRFKYSSYSSSVHPEDCQDTLEDVQWRLDDDGLHFHLINSYDTPFAEDRAVYEAKPYQKIADQ